MRHKTSALKGYFPSPASTNDSPTGRSRTGITCPADAWPDDYLTWPGLLRVPVPEPVHRLLLDLYLRFECRDTPPPHLLSAAFQFPARLADLLQSPLVVILDEFPVLRHLESQRDLGNILGLFRQALSTLSKVLCTFLADRYRFFVQETFERLLRRWTRRVCAGWCRPDRIPSSDRPHP